MRFSPSCECCVVCPIASDTFEREEVGDDWDQIDGDWEIVDDALTTADSDALILFDMDHPAGVTSHIISVEVRGSVGQVGKLAISPAGGPATLTLDLEFGAASGQQCGSLSFGGGGGGFARPVAGVPEDTWIRIGLCFLNVDEVDDPATGTESVAWGQVSANLALTASQRMSSPPMLIVPSVRVGLGTGTSSGGVEFRNFSWFAHKIEGYEGFEEYENCSECGTCVIWTWDGHDDGCEFSVTNDPHADPDWVVEGLIEYWGLNPDFPESIGVTAHITGGASPGEMTLTLGEFEAHFYIDGDHYECHLTGGGIDETEEFDNAVSYSLSILNVGGEYIVCASTHWIDPEGNKSITAVPTSGLGGSFAAGAYGPGAQSNLVLRFTRCPQCPSDNICNACEEDTTTSQFYKITLAGFGEDDFCGTSSDCYLANGTFICAQLLGFPCVWRSVINTSCGQIVIDFGMSGGAVGVTVTFIWTSIGLGSPLCSQTYAFQRIFGGGDDLSSVPCDSLDHDISYLSFTSNDGTCLEIQGYTACSGASLSCHVQSL